MNIKKKKEEIHIYFVHLQPITIEWLWQKKE